eukprot:GHVS01048097.1.p1 GENE.GHVS01048097.1~~GHVS01048097.1.p1  ORF type:complete len:143 (-),score=24.88 GHVS01048097.1:43-471(-)
MTPPLLYLQCVLVVCHSSDVPASRRVLPVHTLPAVRTLPAVHTPTLLHLLFLINLSSYSSSANAPFVLSTNAPSPPPPSPLKFCDKIKFHLFLPNSLTITSSGTAAHMSTTSAAVVQSGLQHLRISPHVLLVHHLCPRSRWA